MDLRSSGGGTGGTTLGRFKNLFGGKSKSHAAISRTSTTVSQSNSNARHLSGGGDGDHSDDDDDDKEIIDHQPWYCGDIPREDTHQMVKADGDYLVRYSKNAKCYVATTKWEGVIRHFAIQKSDEGYRFDGTFHPTISKLLGHYRDNRIPVTDRTQAILIKPINKIVMAKDEYTMKHDDIVLNTKLRKGNFGDVFSGTIRDSQRKVAVKICCFEHFPAVQQFLAEAKILKQCDHPNIVRLLGVCTDKEPLYIVMEWMPGGDFLLFLCNHGANQTIYQLTKYALDAAQGMEYLASKNCIHRDLAARNCLIGENNEILKISNFGMSREADDGNNYWRLSNCELVPIKWTAPESLNLRQYTSASDVWSYGVLLFEIYSCGLAPYPGMSNQQARDQVDQGYRMPPPEGTPKDVYHQVMWCCWDEEPNERPTFTNIVGRLKSIHAKLPKRK